MRTLDAATGRGMSNVVLNLSVLDGECTYGFGTYKSDRHGQILLDYPPGKFRNLRLNINHNDLVDPPYILNVANEQGIFGTEIPARLKRRSAAQNAP